ncbi:hypothetical protein Tco_0667136, partial [Tanacetum coccineum]
IQVVDPEIQVMDEAVDDPDVEENLLLVIGFISESTEQATIVGKVR